MKKTLAAFTLALLSIQGCAQMTSSKWEEWKKEDRARDQAWMAEWRAKAEAQAKASKLTDQHIAEMKARLPELAKAAREQGIIRIVEEYKARGIAISHERAEELWAQRRARVNATFAEIHAADRAKYQMDALSAEVAALRNELQQDSSRQRYRDLQRSYENDMLRLEIERQNLLLMNRGRYPGLLDGYIHRYDGR